MTVCKTPPIWSPQIRSLSERQRSSNPLIEESSRYLYLVGTSPFKNSNLVIYDI